jgi:hypothetical protein
VRGATRGYEMSEVGAQDYVEILNLYARYNLVATQAMKRATLTRSHQMVISTW